MGNAMFNCLQQPATTIRVMRIDGEVLEFDLGHPVIAKQLMKSYPGHVVVHCSAVSRGVGSLGQRSKVSMMRAEDELLPGQTYCLLRVPTQAGAGKICFSKINAPSGVQNNSHTEQQLQISNKSPAEKTSINSNTITICRRKKRRPAKKVVTLRGMFSPGSDVRVCDSDVAQIQKQYSIHAKQQSSYNGPWRPQLDAIIESPLNAYAPSRAHSITMSPLARQAGYIPTSSFPKPPSSHLSARAYA